MLFERTIFKEIKKYIHTDNILVLHGARQVGKTHIMKYLEQYLKKIKQNSYFFDLEDRSYLEILDNGVDEFLQFLTASGIDLEKYKNKNKKFFVFIDEIQYLKNPSSFLKLIADHHKYLQLIVSGSSSFAIKSKFSDSLAGRTVNFEIFNLSFQEFLQFKKNTINLKKLDEHHLKKIKDLWIEYTLYGGYPKIVLEKSIEKKEKYLKQIVETYVKKDISALANIKNIDKFNALLKVLAIQGGQMLRIAELSNLSGLAKNTIEEYLFILENTYIIKLLKPFSRKSGGEVVKMPKIFFFDTGLMQILKSNSLNKEIDGAIFETSIFNELNKKYDHSNLHYWRNKNQNEIDFIVENKNELLPIEVKKNFSKFKKSSMEFFVKKYNFKNFYIVGLDGFKQGINQKYPWEI